METLLIGIEVTVAPTSSEAPGPGRGRLCPILRIEHDEGGGIYIWVEVPPAEHDPGGLGKIERKRLTKRCLGVSTLRKILGDGPPLRVRVEGRCTGPSFVGLPVAVQDPSAAEGETCPALVLAQWDHLTEAARMLVALVPGNEDFGVEIKQVDLNQLWIPGLTSTALRRAGADPARSQIGARAYGRLREALDARVGRTWDPDAP